LASVEYTIHVRDRQIQKSLLIKEKSAVTNVLPHGEYRDENTSAVFAIYSILRRQPWKTMAIKTWDAMKRLFLAGLLAASLGALLPPAVAHATTVKVLTSDVPFDFQVGERTFKPGRYQFVVLSPGRLAIRDARAHYVATITTRDRDMRAPVTKTKLVFDTRKKRAQLVEIWIEDNSEVMDVVGEEIAVRPATIGPPPPMLDVTSFFERRAEPGLKY
jgi:hypothetical protein